MSVKQRLGDSCVFRGTECQLIRKRQALLLIEYQNDFTSEGGALHQGVKPVMQSTNMLANSVQVATRRERQGSPGCSLRTGLLSNGLLSEDRLVILDHMTIGQIEERIYERMIVTMAILRACIQLDGLRKLTLVCPCPGSSAPQFYL